MNTIDTVGLLLNTFQFVSSSHPATITWLPLEQSMKFLFNNILLADSNVNEPMSHGFIRYRITPKANLLVGDSITSQAFIFFDFNALLLLILLELILLLQPEFMNMQIAGSY